MSKHEEKTTEQLSAYIDDELPADEIREVESLLAHDKAVRQRLEGLRKVVDGLRQTEPPPPPPTLHHAVARRIALEREQVPFLDRFEANLSPLARHNPLMPMFAVVLVLAIAIYFFAVMVERANRGDTEVVVVGSTETGTTMIGARIEVAGRILFWDGALWRERDAPVDADHTIVLGSADAEALLAANPDLEAIVDLGVPALIVLEGTAVRLDPATAP